MSVRRPAIRNLPVRFDPAVKERVEQDAAARERSLNDVVVGRVAGHYGIPFDGTGRRSPGANGAPAMNLRFPKKVYDRLDRDSFRLKKSKNELVERILCNDYGIEYVPRPTGRTVAA